MQASWRAGRPFGLPKQDVGLARGIFPVRSESEAAIKARPSFGLRIAHPAPHAGEQNGDRLKRAINRACTPGVRPRMGAARLGAGQFISIGMSVSLMALKVDKGR